ncbi:MAG: hypothetical protein ACYCW6_23010, partial [Candidatus Xenobia bacterium]
MSPHEQLMKFLADWKDGALSDDALQQTVGLTTAQLLVTAGQMRKGLGVAMSADMRAAGEQALAALERYSEALGNASAALSDGERAPMEALAPRLEPLFAQL